MMRVLFLKEIREAFASRRFWVVLVLCLILIPLGVEVSLKDYQTRLHNYQEAVRIYQDQTKTVFNVLYNDGGKAFAPPSPLSFLSHGLELVLPNIAETQAKYMQPPAVMRFSNNQGRDNLYEFFYGPFDLIFIIGVVMSFLAVIMTYGAIAGEKEQGTLRQILSNSVPRAKIILAKATANGVVLIIPFLLALVLSLAILEVQGNPSLFVGGAWILIMVAVLVTVLLIGAFFNLGLLISALTKQAVPALVTLLLAWVFLYGVYPRLAAAAAQVIYPVKSEARVALEKNQIRRNIEKERDGETNLVAKIMPKDEKSEAYKEGQQKQLDIYNKYQSQLEKSWQILERDTEERRKTGIALTADIARLSPVSCFIRPLAELGRTGWLEYQQFSTQVRQYLDVLNRDIFKKQIETRMKGWSDTEITAYQSAAAPVFKYVRAPAEVVIRNVLPDIVMLILFNLVFFAGAFIGFIRYDPR